VLNILAAIGVRKEERERDIQNHFVALFINHRWHLFADLRLLRVRLFSS
jgi:hypothetical protein